MSNAEDSIVADINDWRAEMVDNIAPEFTDDLNGPIRNLPALEGDDLAMLRMEIQSLLSRGWTTSLVKKYLKYTEEVCPFWTEEFALRRLKEVRDRAILQGAK